MFQKSVRIAAVLALATGLLAPKVGAAQATVHDRAKVALSAAKIIIELNDTAQDVGVQVFLDGEPWRTMKIFDPRGRKLFEVSGHGSVGALGMTELFFESNEPELAELPLDDLFELFPAGQYIFIGETIEGDKISGRAKFTHAIPAGPVVVSPLAGDIEDPGHTVIDWLPVADPAGSHIVEYQIIVERLNPLRVFTVNVLADTTSIQVPPEFMEAGTDYIFEVLAIEAGGNQTITEGSFSTE
jgi:hypothetical protein